MGRILAGIMLGFVFMILSGGTLHAADCEFRLGFKTLRDLIGHDIVGECLENEHYNEIGDSNQQTTGGLMAWRKADNWTAFTDGYRTWIKRTQRACYAAQYRNASIGKRTYGRRLHLRRLSPSRNAQARMMWTMRTTSTLPSFPRMEYVDTGET